MALFSLAGTWVQSLARTLVVVLGGYLCLASSVDDSARAQGASEPPLVLPAAPIRRTALSLVGKPRFEGAFAQFDWVNPNAPKGGHVRLWQRGSFDSLNNFSIKGERAASLDLLFDTLMARSLDQQATEYCLVCEWVSYPDDYSSVTFRIRKIARFNDGTPITADDVIFSLNAIRKAHPFYRAYYRNVSEVVKNGDHEVTFKFNAKGNRELPQIMGQLTVLPRHYWLKKGRDGKERDISKSSLDVPVGSGPYRIKSFEATREIVYERVKNWWAKDLPVTRGQWNFDRVTFTYFRDQTPAFEAFKTGTIDFWIESSAKNWATRFGFRAARQGLVKTAVYSSKARCQHASLCDESAPAYLQRYPRA